MSKSDRERLAVVEALMVEIKEDVNFIRDNMVSIQTVRVLKWAMGGILTLSIAALTMALR